MPILDANMLSTLSNKNRTMKIKEKAEQERTDEMQCQLQWASIKSEIEDIIEKSKSKTLTNSEECDDILTPDDPEYWDNEPRFEVPDEEPQADFLPRILRTAIQGPQREMIEIAPIPDKGLGVRALKSMVAGTRVGSEKVYLRKPMNDNDNRDLFRQFHALPKAVRRGLLTLPYPKEKDKTILSIFEEHFFMSEMDHMLYMSLVASQFNHSCIPNTEFSYNTVTDKITIHLIRDVEEGEELVVTYLGAFGDYEGRKSNLEVYWGFLCDCAACQPTTIYARQFERDRRKVIDSGCMWLFQDGNSEPDPNNAARTAFMMESYKRMRTCLENETYFGSTFGCVCFRGGLAARHLEDLNLALEWYRRSAEAFLLCAGSDSPWYQEACAGERSVRCEMDKALGDVDNKAEASAS